MNSFSLIEASTVDAIATLADIDPTYLSDVSTTDVITSVHGAITEQMKDSLPSCVFWSYNDSNLLPEKVDLASFASNPNICLPLKQMFALADFTDIQADVTEAQGKTNGLKNLLNRVATRTTEHMHRVWKEHKGIQFQVVPDGTNISVAIKDTHNEYDLSRRSDGFKRFITFLLLISAKAKTADLENTLYLHDEPEAGLHPSGARYLRDELIKIAEKNYVVYSTHSIFMIDKENVGRHLIVKKDKEITTAVKASSSTINDEEVVYNALGYSVFETLKPQNIIFEGWRDKKLFQVAVALHKKSVLQRSNFKFGFLNLHNFLVYSDFMCKASCSL